MKHSTLLNQHPLSIGRTIAKKREMKSIPKEHSSVIYQRVIRAYQTEAVLFQLDLLKENFRFNFMIYVDFFLIFHYFVSTVHTAITKWEDFGAVLRVMCLEGLNIQLFAKDVTLVYYAKDIYLLSKTMLDVHNNSDGPYQQIMYKWAGRLMMLTKVQFFVYMGTSIGFCLYPLYCYVAHNKKVLTYDLLLPFDPTTKNGYTVTIVIQTFFTYGTYIVIFAVDLLFILMMLSGTALFSLFDCDCKILTIAINNSEETNRNNDSNDDVHKLFMKCIERSQFIYKYFGEVCKIFSYYCLAQVYCSALSILLCVFVAKTSNWFVVYLIALSGVYQLTVYCVVGTVVEYKSEEISKSVYDIPWYNLTVSEQLMVKLLLQFVQKTIAIKVLGERKLTIETGVDVYKSIYSAFVMLEQFY